MASCFKAETGLAGCNKLHAVRAPGNILTCVTPHGWVFSGSIDMFVLSKSKATPWESPAAHGNATIANVVNDVPNESSLERAQWGKAAVE